MTGIEMNSIVVIVIWKTVSHRWFNNKVRTHTRTHTDAAGYTHTYTHAATCICYGFGSLQYEWLYVWVSRRLLASSYLPHNTMANKQVSIHKLYISCCLCLSAKYKKKENIKYKRNEPFSGLATCAKFHAEQWKVRRLGQKAKTAPTHAHPHAHRNKYSYWACKKRLHNYWLYNKNE